MHLIPDFYRRRIACLSLALPASLLGCGGSSDDGSVVYVDGLRVKTRINKSNVYDLEVTGGDCEVTIAADNTVKRLIISGISNKVIVEAGAKIELVDFAGRSNRVSVPAGFKTRVVNSGDDNKLIER